MKAILTVYFLCVMIICGCTSGNDKKTASEFAAVSQVQYGKAVNIMMTAYKTTMIADGKDETLIRIVVIDSAGREITSASRQVRIYLTGDATVKGAEEKYRLEPKTDKDGKPFLEGRISNGLCLLNFIAGTKPDKIKLEVKSDSIWPGSHEIHTIPSDVKLLKPSADQIKPLNKRIGKSIGADISFLPQIEARGKKFVDNSQEKDLVKILASHGFNYIRLRIFVNPENEKGYSPDKGFCGLEYTKAMAKRAKEAGMKLLLNFHYSDYWADPQQQYKPKAWENIDFKTLKDSLKLYTKRVLIAMRDQGTLPEMVQVGNEINHGLLWPDGHISNPDKLAELLKAGVEAVREVDPSIVVMMHIALGGQNNEATFWLDNMIARGVDFDLIGLSYYPRWHGTLDDLKFNLNDLATRYKKDVNVVEYSIFKKEIHDIVFNLADGRGEGTFIWEPINSFFDMTGNPTDELKIYDEISKKYLVK
jgi:arabinogalactan endo-1,4-beta-galactosidase